MKPRSENPRKKPSTGPRTLDEFRRIVIAGARSVGESFTNPEDDWLAVLHVQHPEGVSLAALDSSLFASDDAKDSLGEMLKRFVAQLGAYRYCLLVSAWSTPEGLSAQELEQMLEAGLRVRDLHDRKEILALTIGDAEEEQLWLAEIHRHADRPPTLGAFKRLPLEGVAVGRFAGLNAYL